MDLSIIYVNWNSAQYIGASIASVFEQTVGIEAELIVVDNASPLDDLDVLERAFPQIKLIRSPVNLGFGRANNLGFEASSGKAVLFLNPDTKLVNRAINQMLEQLRSLPDAGVVGCKLLNSDLSIQTSCIQTFPSILNQVLDAELLRGMFPRSTLFGIGPLFSEDTRPARVEVVSGACMLLRREVFEKAGWFSEEYFMYAEDLDLCRKVVEAGYSNFYVSTGTVIHYGGKSSNPATATVRKWQSILQYVRKHRGPAYALLFRLLLSGAAVARLGCLAMAVMLRKGRDPNSTTSPTVTKWKAILITLVTFSGGPVAASYRQPGGSRQKGGPIRV